MTESFADLPSGWALTTVGAVGTVRLGRQRSPANQSGRYSAKYIRAANITAEGLDLRDLLEMDFTPEERLIYSLRSGDILLAEASGSGKHVGRAALWVDEIPDCYYQNTVIRFRSHTTLAEYALIVFRHHALSGIFARTAKGTGILHLGATRFAALPFPLPPQGEQLRIVNEVAARTRGIRDSADSLESARIRVIEQNQAILTAAAMGTLVEPEATIARRENRAYEDGMSLLTRVTEGDSPSSESSGTVQIASEAAALNRADLPPGWIWSRIGDVGEVSLGRQRAPKYETGPHMRPYLRVANILEDRIDTSDILRMNFSPDEYEIYSLQFGDILLVEASGSPKHIGRPAMYREEVPGACFQNHLLRFRATSAVDPDFALLVFRHYLHSGAFAEIARGATTLANLSLRRFINIPFPLPPLREQERIASEAKRRLRESSDQEAIIQRSLNRLPEVEAELLNSAVHGYLVRQDPEEESAIAFLERVGSPAPDVSESEDSAEEEESRTYMPVIQQVSRHATLRRSLASVLHESGQPLSLPELYALAGYDRDSTEDVEQFYLELRAELNRSIQSHSTENENVTVEAISNATD